MKGDFSRHTFDRKKHFSGVRMQQGRVQLDADWNEQSDIINYRAEITALDIIGGCGGPLHHAGFQVALSGKSGEAEREVRPVAEESKSAVDASRVDASKSAVDKRKLTAFAPSGGAFAPAGGGALAPAGSNFTLSAGRYYVDGILCENEQELLFTAQPDFPGAGLPEKAGVYLVYLDVWQRHLTMLDEPRIREIALGGPDTATRVRTIWQAKTWLVPEKLGNCLNAFAAFKKFISRTEGTLNAGTTSEKASDDPCIVPPSAGYRGLENQLYRVEIHDGGEALNVTSVPAGEEISEIIGTNKIRISGGGKWEAGKAVEIYATKAGSNPLAGTIAYVTNYDKDSGTLTLNTTLIDIDLDTDPFVRPVGATYKWSRDNGIVVSLIEKIDADNNKITVQSIGPDDTLGFDVNQWVEITDDARELNGLPGQLAQIADINRTTREITLKSKPVKLGTKDGVNPKLKPKLRRWDGVGAVNFSTIKAIPNWLALEDGVQVQFDGKGQYRTGDFWVIAARAATADVESGHIEWPADTGGKPAPQPPLGIRHHYCPLALYDWGGGKSEVKIDDCRSLFPPITELTALHYVSGDGQEIRPTLADPKPKLAPKLMHPLVVGVSNGKHPVAGARVQFSVAAGNGVLTEFGKAETGETKLIVKTDEHGLATCEWHLANTDLTSQQAEAELQNSAGQRVHLPVRFNANLSVAAEVAYKPGECDKLAGVLTVQAALDQLCQLIGINDEPGIHIKSVFTVDEANSKQPFTPLENDSDVAFDALAAGIMIQCDQPVFADSVRDKPVCFVTLEMPYPFNSVDRQLWSSGAGSGPDSGFPVIGFNPLILDAETMIEDRSPAGVPTKTDLSQITWRPTFGTRHWLRTQLSEMIHKTTRFSETRQGRVLAHLTLKGNFIWAGNKPELYLDGNVFGASDSTIKGARTALRLPSGDGKRGGDFEMWFWLVTFQLQVDPATVLVGQEATGTVRLISGFAPKSGAKILLESANPAVAEPKVKSVTIPAGQESVQFPIATKAGGNVVIRARYAGGSHTDTLNVIADTMRVKNVRILRTNGVPDTQNPVELVRMSNPKTVLEVSASNAPDVIEVEFTLPANAATVTPNQTFTVTPEFSSPPTPLAGKIIVIGNKTIARWSRTQGSLTTGTYIVTLVGSGQPAIANDSGMTLDGDPAQLPSGDGSSGGNFTFKLNVRAATPVPVAPSLLKVARVRVLRVKTPTDTSPGLLFDMQQIPPGGIVTLTTEPRFNCIEVHFTGAAVNRESVISELTFVVNKHTFINNQTIESRPGDIIEVTTNVVRWIHKGATGAISDVPFAAQDFYRVRLFGNPNSLLPGTSGTIVSKEGKRLDGEPTKLPSGDNNEGGDFFFEIRRPAS